MGALQTGGSDMVVVTVPVPPMPPPATVSDPPLLQESRNNEEKIAMMMRNIRNASMLCILLRRRFFEIVNADSRFVPARSGNIGVHIAIMSCEPSVYFLQEGLGRASCELSKPLQNLVWEIIIGHLALEKGLGYVRLQIVVNGRDEVAHIRPQYVHFVGLTGLWYVCPITKADSTIF
jgi:hypothetical protein